MSARTRLSLKPIVLATCVAALVIACGGGGGDGGGPTPPPPLPNLPPTTGPGDPMNYAPLAAGDTWTYNALASEASVATPERDLATVWVNGSATVKGETVTVLTERMFSDALAPTFDMYYRKGPGGVAFYGTSDATDRLTNGVVPYAELLFPVAVGPIVSFTKTGLDFGEDLDGDGRNETVDATSSIRIEAFEPVTVPAGSFAAAAKRVNTIAATARLTTTGQTVAVSVVETSWIAPGAGLVRSDTRTNAAGTPLQLLTSVEARGYTVNGVRRGMGNPEEIAAGLGPLTQTNFGEPPAQIDKPAAASSGASFLVIAKSYTPDPSGKWRLVRKGFLRSPAGAASAPFDLGPAVLSNDTRETQSLAFGGGTYLAVFEQRNPIAPDIVGTTEPSIVVQRIAPDGTPTDDVPKVLVPQGTAPMLPGLVSRLPTLAYGGGQFLVVYCAGDGTSSQTWIEGRMVAPDGSLGLPFRISPDYAFNGMAPRVVFDGTQFIVAAPDGGGGWRLVRVTPGGTVLDPAGVGIAVAAPRIRLTTSGAGGVLVAWIDGMATPFARRYSAELAALDAAPIALAGGAGARYSINAGFLGGEYVVLWSERYPAPFGQQLVLYLTRIGPDGAVRGQSAPVDAAAGNAPYAALATPVAPLPPSGYTGGFALPSFAVGSDAALLAYVHGTGNGFTLGERLMALNGIWVHPFAK